MPYFTYILYAEPIDQFYVGATQDLADRLTRHNQGRSKATKKGAPHWVLFYCEEFATKREALSRERHFKRMRNRAYFLSTSVMPAPALDPDSGLCYLAGRPRFFE